MPASRAVALAERLSSRSKIPRAVPAVGTFIITSKVLPAGMNTSLSTRGTPGSTLPSSAMSEKPATAVGVPVCALTIDGTCIRRPALTRRTSTVPVTPLAGAVANNEAAAFVLSKAVPLIR